MGVNNTVKFLSLFRPAMNLLPEVDKPPRNVTIYSNSYPPPLQLTPILLQLSNIYQFLNFLKTNFI